MTHAEYCEATLRNLENEDANVCIYVLSIANNNKTKHKCQHSDLNLIDCIFCFVLFLSFFFFSHLCSHCHILIVILGIVCFV